MPVKNIVKVYGEDQYYHVYNRGVAKAAIFYDEDDYRFMLSLFKRYLSDRDTVDRFGRVVPNYRDEIELVAYCLMPNHFHLMVYLKECEGLVRLMRSVMTAYSMYFNKKYQRVGGLFQGSFLASRIDNDAYFWHISRYIHLNAMDLAGVDYLEYPYSSIGYYAGVKHASWIHPERIIDRGTSQKYAKFLDEYEDRHRELNQIKHLLAAE